jgi:hypothetical protein
VSAGRLIPNAISLAWHVPVNGATIECDEPLTAMLPQEPWAYGLFFPMRPRAFANHQGPAVVQIDLAVISGSVGVAAVDRLMQIVGLEQLREPGDSLVQIRLPDPSQTFAIVLRHADARGTITRVTVRDIGAFTPAAECLAARRHDLGHDLFVILAPPKTATQTIEQTLVALSRAAEVRRIHYVSEAGADRDRALALASAHTFGQKNELWASSLRQAADSDAVRQEIADVRRLGGRVALITAFREPIGQALAAMFEVMAFFVPAFAALHGPHFIQALTCGVIAAWRKQLAGDTEYNMWSSCVNAAGFYGHEFDALSIDLRAHPFDRDSGYVLFEHDNDSVLAIRTPDIGCALPTALSRMTGRSGIALVSANVAATKNVGPLYRDFLARFSVPADLIDAIYARNPWLNYFYSPAEIETMRRRWLRPASEQSR